MEQTVRKWKSSADLVDRGFAIIQQRMRRDRSFLGIDSGFRDLNRILSGLQRGNVIVLGSRPAMGKTALMQNIVLHVVEQEMGVGVFSLSDSGEQFVLRLLAMKSEISMSAIRSGMIDQQIDFPRIMDACEKIHSLPIFLQDDAVSIDDIVARTMELYEQKGNLSMVVIDDIGLLRSSSMLKSRAEMISEASSKLKDLAKRLDICILILSQVRRRVEKRIDKRPILSDLSGTGALEQDADVVCFLYRDEYYDLESLDRGSAELIIAKHKTGSIGMVKLGFEGKYLQFFDWNRE